MENTEDKKPKKIHPVVEKIRKIMNDRNLTQKAIGDYAEIHETQMSRIFSGKLQFSIWQLEDIARNLNMSLVDLFTYPKKFVDKDSLENPHDRISITFEVSADKREHLLKLVMGEKEKTSKE